MASTDDFILTALLTLCMLLLAAKVAGEVAKRLGFASVVGEILAGVVMAPTLLGGMRILGIQLVVLNDPVRMFAELGAIMLLFLAGLETRFADFIKSGFISTMVATGGVIVPFVLAYGLTTAWGYGIREALLVGASVTATSVAITVKVLKDLGRSGTKESGILIGAAVIDDVLGLVVLAIVLGMIGDASLDMAGIATIAIEAIVFWVVLTLAGVFLVSKIIDRLCPRAACNGGSGHCMLPCNGAQEASIMAMCFGFAYLAAMAGLSPILGAFSAGMSVAETRILPNIRGLAEKINFVMAPLFFVVIGIYVDLTGLGAGSLAFAAMLILLAMLGKVVGCGAPVLLINRDLKHAIIVGLGMMSRGEVGLIIAGIGATSGVFSGEVFSAVVLMVVVTTVVTPVALKAAYALLHVESPYRNDLESSTSINYG